RSGGSLTQALAAARPGDVVALEPGASYRGPFSLPRKEGPGWIVVTTAGAAAVLPARGRRVHPSDAIAMAKLVSSSGSVVSASPGAHHYRFVGLELSPAAGAFLYNVVDLSPPDSAPEETPHHIVFDRCY